MHLSWNDEARALNLRLHGEDFGDIDQFDWTAARVLTGTAGEAAPTGRVVAIAAIYDRVDTFVLERTDDRWTLARMRRATRAEREQLPQKTRFAGRSTDAAEKALRDAIATDPASAGPHAGEFAAMRPAFEALPATFFVMMEELRRHRARGRALSQKRQITLRLDADVLDSFRAEGTGWQSRINDALRRARGL